MEQFDRILDAILSDPVASIFCSLILGWLLLALLMISQRGMRENPFSSRFAAITPNSLATLGVLGTFTGILIGLLDFDVTDINKSVPALLAGLKIAFTTSIVGIAAAIVFRLARTVAPSSSTSTGTTPEDIHAALLDIRDDGRSSTEKASAQLAELRKAISSDGDGSLLTQLQKLRASVQDGQTELTREFREFAGHMVENNQKAIIEALENVIRDFNRNLTEQFGENFKQLNTSVSGLVEWQDNYRVHVEALEDRLASAVSAVEASRDALSAVREHAERIPEAIKPLEPVLVAIKSQTDTMGAHLETLAGLRDKAIEAFPVIEANLEKVTTNFARGVEDAVSASRKALDDGETAQGDLRRGYENFLKHATAAGESFSTELTKTLQEMSESSAREFARHGELIDQTSKEAQSAITNGWSQTQERMNEQFGVFDDQMQKELNRCLELLGRNLASISEKFVADYSPLADRLANVTRAESRAG